MFGTVQIGEKAVPFKASGATPLFFKNIFKDDLLNSFTKLSDEDVGTSADLLCKLAYVMNAQAEKKNMSELNFESFAEWIDQYDPNDIPEKGAEIIEIYAGNLQTGSSAKKKNNP